MRIEKIQSDLKQSILNRDKIKSTNIRTLLGEIQRHPDKKTDVDTIQNLITKMIKQAQKLPNVDKKWVELLESYVTSDVIKATEEDVIKYINEKMNIDEYPNRMKAMGPLMKQFKGSIDGNEIRRILTEMK